MSSASSTASSPSRTVSDRPARRDDSLSQRSPRNSSAASSRRRGRHVDLRLGGQAHLATPMGFSPFEFVAFSESPDTTGLQCCQHRVQWSSAAVGGVLTQNQRFSLPPRRRRGQ